MIARRSQGWALAGPHRRRSPLPPARARAHPKVANSIDRGTSKLHAIRLHPPCLPPLRRGAETGFNIEENYVIGSRYALVAEGGN